MREKIKNWLQQNWFRVITIIFLLGALADNPYSYYQFLRWIILGIGAYSAYLAYNSGRKIWTGIFGIITLVFNPIIPFYFQRDIWQSIDVIVAIIFSASLFIKYERKN